jgi:hypothetical protein
VRAEGELLVCHQIGPPKLSLPSCHQVAACDQVASFAVTQMNSDCTSAPRLWLGRRLVSLVRLPGQSSLRSYPIGTATSREFVTFNLSVRTISIATGHLRLEGNHEPTVRACHYSIHELQLRGCTGHSVRLCCSEGGERRAGDFRDKT